METVQQGELQGRQHAWWWPLDTMACSSSSDTSNSDSCFLRLGWDPQLRYFGPAVVGVAAGHDPHDHRTIEHELGLFFPKCMESSGALQEGDATATPEDQLDELLRNFWDAEEQTEDEQMVGCNSSCILKDKSASAASSFLDDDDDLLALCSAAPVDPTLPEKPAPSSFSSHCSVAPHAGDAQRQITHTTCSSKRLATQEGTDAWNSKRSRTAAFSGAGSSVVRPFTVVKPRGADGVVTLADINERNLSRPTRPLRHPVGEFACAPRAFTGGDNRPTPSGKAVVGFARLHTAGKGTITVIRTSG
ncbi:unnamed protein product [Alopecurus aequalis]